jgi:RNA polymerase sigma-70 factor (ECF subfamily)
MAAKSGNLTSEPAGEPPRVVDLDERSWLPRHCRGDAAAFPALLEAYRRPVYSYLVRAGVGEADRDDIFQSVFLKIHRAAETYEPARPLAPWIFTIVANSVRNHWRDGQTLPSVPSPEGPPDIADPDPGPERTAQGREMLAWIENAVAALPPAQREVLLLTAIVGLPQQQVADTLDLPLNTVKTQLRRARLALAKALNRDDPPPGAAGEHHDQV